MIALSCDILFIANWTVTRGGVYTRGSGGRGGGGRTTVHRISATYSCRGMQHSTHPWAFTLYFSPYQGVQTKITTFAGTSSCGTYLVVFANKTRWCDISCRGGCGGSGGGGSASAEMAHFWT